MVSNGGALLVKVAGELNFSTQDFLVDNHGVNIVEGVDTGEHLVSQNAQGPPVNRLSVALV